MTQWDVWIARRLHIVGPVARLYAAISSTRSRLGHRGAVLVTVACWHTLVGASLMGYTFQGPSYRLVEIVPASAWAVIFLLSAGWAAASGLRSQGHDRSGFMVSAGVTILWGLWLGIPAWFLDYNAVGARAAGSFCVIGVLLVITAGWRER